ncbi:MAG: U32 family peptidase [Desulfurivibrio sp.]|nr:U32 family peptidase [Desulfurivibrio sp.]
MIIQDLGLHALCRRYFPKLPLHASTLLGAHNSLAVAQFAAMGFSRLVLARELSLGEIETIAVPSAPELEVFVHGAMCFSYSGLCLFSSYGGGKSSTRGRCVQPCRRRYRWGDGKKGGYLFSMNDLEGLAYLPALQEAGVAAVKIEGRLKNAAYVSLVTRAYRLVLDALAVATPRRERGVGHRHGGGTGIVGPGPGTADRRTGFLSLPPRELVSARPGSGHIGDFLGRIERCRGRWATLSSSRLVGKGDRLRLHREASGERLAFSVKEVRPAAAGKQSAAPAAGIEAAWRGDILLPASAAAGDSLYLVDTAANRRGERRQLVVKQHHQRRAGEVSTGKVARRLAANGYGSLARARQESAVAGGKARKPESFLLAALAQGRRSRIAQATPAGPGGTDRVAVDPGKPRRRWLARFPRPLRGRLIWALPPVILEEELPFHRREIAALPAAGLQAWQLAPFEPVAIFYRTARRDDGGSGGWRRLSLSQKAEQPGPASRRRPPASELYGDYTLNILNSLALDNCRAAGLRPGAARCSTGTAPACANWARPDPALAG